MLLKIQSPAQPAAAEDAVDLLLECHGRIRYFTELALQLATVENARPSEIANAADRVVRYFSIALPLHSADEDESLAPRLRAVGLDDQLLEAVEAMTAQHHEIHRVTDEVVSFARLLIDRPELLPDVSSQLAAAVRRLDALFGVHLSAEESLIFPFARRRLSADDQQAIVSELRARRR